MKLTKRVFTALLALLMFALCVGCGEDGESSASGLQTPETTNASSVTEGTKEENDMTTTSAEGITTSATTSAATSTDRPSGNTQVENTTGNTTQRPATTTQEPSKQGYVSKSDTSVEPVRSLSQILASIPQADLSCDKYDLEKYLTPYWEGNIVYNESLSFITDPKTGRAEAPLLYDAAKVLSVKNSALNITYKEGVDYTVENGKIVLTGNSSIYKFAYGDVYFNNEKSGACFPLKKGGYSLFYEGTYFHEKQIAVTYLHENPWKGYKPAYQGGLLPKVINKLTKGENVSIVYLGDSIVKGGNASGMFGAAPNMPIWTDMVTAALEKAYPKAKITTFSASENGATTVQALKNLRTLCSEKKPDLVIIGFGMNDGSDAGITPEAYQNNIRTIMETNDMLTGKSCDYLLLSTTLPNQEIKLGTANNQEKLAAKLFELEKAGTATTGGVVVGDMTAIHKKLLETKRFFDMTANNVNHPNDFLVRAYAQVVTTMLIK